MLCRTLRAPLLACVIAIAAPLLATSLSTPAFAGDQPPDVLAGADVQVRLANAEKLEKSDIRALALGLIALGERKEPGPEAIEFLTEYIIREESRILRLLAIDAAKRLDQPRAAELLAKRADAQDLHKTIYAIHGLGYVADKPEVPKLLELLGNSNDLIAIEAARALAQAGPKKQVDDVIAVGLAHANAHVTDHAMWAAQDILKKEKPLLAKLGKLAKKKNFEHAIRAESAIALIHDKLGHVHKWSDGLKALRKAIKSVPDEVKVEAVREQYETKIRETLGWLKTNMPGQWLTVLVSVKSIEASGKTEDRAMDLGRGTIFVPLSYMGQAPNKLSYQFVRPAGVMLQKLMDQPSFGHRGWEPSIFDTYDVCVVAKLYDAGPGGLTRKGFIETILGKRPWGGY